MFFDCFDFIEKKNPLKQGLKQNYFSALPISLNIEKKNPLKQGLKHFYCIPHFVFDRLKRRIH